MSDFDIVIYGGGHRCEGWSVDEPVKPQQGYGGHPIGARPKRKSLTVYEGRQPFQLIVPMMFYRGGASVERDRMALDEMATAQGVLPADEPPGVKIEAEFPLPIPPVIMRDPHLEWWIEDIDWKDEVRNPPDGPQPNPSGIVGYEHVNPANSPLGEGFVRVNQPSVEKGHITRKLVTVTLLEKVDETLLGQKKNSEGRQHTWTIRRRKGTKKNLPETFEEVATHAMGAKTKKEIENDVHMLKELNKLRSSNQLHVGQVIKLPVGAQTVHHKKAKK